MKRNLFEEHCLPLLESNGSHSKPFLLPSRRERKRKRNSKLSLESVATLSINPWEDKRIRPPEIVRPGEIIKSLNKKTKKIPVSFAYKALTSTTKTKRKRNKKYQKLAIICIKKRIGSNLRHWYNSGSKKDMVWAPCPNDNEGRFFRIRREKNCSRFCWFRC